MYDLWVQRHNKEAVSALLHKLEQAMLMNRWIRRRWHQFPGGTGMTGPKGPEPRLLGRATPSLRLPVARPACRGCRGAARPAAVGKPIQINGGEPQHATLPVAFCAPSTPRDGPEPRLFAFNSYRNRPNLGLTRPRRFSTIAALR